MESFKGMLRSTALQPVDNDRSFVSMVVFESRVIDKNNQKLVNVFCAFLCQEKPFHKIVRVFSYWAQFPFHFVRDLEEFVSYQLNIALPR